MTTERGHWGSRFGFVLAAAGSAVGLGNIWKFPYITGENGGGLFVLIYLFCIALVAMPIMMAEIFVGRTAQRSPVGAFRSLSRSGSPWVSIGWLGVAAGFVILSYYSVVAGWAMQYSYVAITEGFAGKSAEEIQNFFGKEVFTNPKTNIMWHVIFMLITILIVCGGIRRGIELTARILMPLLLVMLLVLLYYATQSGGFGQAFEFVFKPNVEKIGAPAIMEALGHSFFTLSLGMGAMITYGSYLRRDDDLVKTSFMVGFLDTGVALLACLVMFPFVFAAGLEAGAGPGLVFVSLPIAFSGMAAGGILAPLFFLLLTFAALTSAISLLEVVSSYFIDEKQWGRKTAAIVCGLLILVLGIPSALSGGSADTGGTDLFSKKTEELTKPMLVAIGRVEDTPDAKGMNWFDFFDYIASNWMLTLGGLGIALFVAWRVGGEAREMSFKAGTTLGHLYWGWVFLLRFLVPLGVIAVLIHSTGLEAKLRNMLGF